MDDAICLFESMGYAEADIRSTVQQLIEVPLPSPQVSSPHPQFRIPVFSSGFKNLGCGPEIGISLEASMLRREAKWSAC
jgi:hypothetical protein